MLKTGKILRLTQEILFLLICGFFFACMFYACASVGSPQGGPVDEQPPHFVSSNPHPNTINYNKNKVEIFFDELIVLDNPSSNVIITPPQIQFPVIKALGKKITVEIKDSLIPNATYTIDFGNAITDNNEKNVLENFSFAFSTGDIVDSLEVSGALLNAENLEPMPGILIGLHKNLEDTAFTRIPFFRTTKTNEKGQFRIRNIAPGTYRIYALNDLNRDYKFDQPGEEIAFYDSLVVPSFIPSTRIDTIWKDSITVDTIFETHYSHFIPDDIVLFLFKEKFERQYLRKSERAEAHKFSLFFNAPVDTLPRIRFLNVPDTSEDFAVLEYTEMKKTLNYWLKDSMLYLRDTLKIEASYIKSDSLNRPEWGKDTLSLFLKKKVADKKDKKKKDDKITFLGINIQAPSVFEIFDTVKVKFTEPVPDFNPAHIVLQQKRDTVRWDTLKYTIIPNTLNPMEYLIYYKWDYEKEYKIHMDSAVFTSMYGKWNDDQEVKFKTKTRSDYGHLYVNIIGTEGNGFGELLDGSDKVVRKAPLKDGGILFMNLKPAKYYLRYIADTNGNGVWDTGNYELYQHPEQVYYYPGYLEIPQNFDVEQSWDVTETPFVRQKLLEITKNKPKEKKNVNQQRNATGNNPQQRPGTRNPGVVTP